MRRAFYSAPISEFLSTSTESVISKLTSASLNAGFPPEEAQVSAWGSELEILRTSLGHLSGKVYLEFNIPRMGLRADAILLLDGVLVVLEFKVGEKSFSRAAREQVWDYALDLKNFHSTSHHLTVIPVVVATDARGQPSPSIASIGEGDVPEPLLATSSSLNALLESVRGLRHGPALDPAAWECGNYSPTPTIIEAALALYKHHSVEEISRSDAAATNLTSTSEIIEGIVKTSRETNSKSICFVTGVPGAGKTLVGLNIATKYLQKDSPWHSVYLSGNGPLVEILVEALARDKREQLLREGVRSLLKTCRSDVKTFIQNVHHFRDEYLEDEGPPHEHVTIFDEAQRAWTKRQSASFMKRRKGHPNFAFSEPGFLISCLDRHSDWSTVVCLVGGGQEINTGEAGISEWLDSLHESFPGWQVHLSDRLLEREYDAGDAIARLRQTHAVQTHPELHLGVSLRSFRAEHVSDFVSHVLALEQDAALACLGRMPKYPIRVTRSLPEAKVWLRKKARGSERYGMMVSSRAERLKPHAIDVRAKVNPVHWFLDGREDTRSSFYLEDAATEFQVQGLELDWGCVIWDADLRYSDGGWKHFEFKGKKWQRVVAAQRQRYLLNTYRVLLTRARQGMVIVVPPGERSDPTRAPDFYDPTYDYLRRTGLESL